MRRHLPHQLIVWLCVTRVEKYLSSSPTPTLTSKIQNMYSRRVSRLIKKPLHNLRSVVQRRRQLSEHKRQEKTSLTVLEHLAEARKRLLWALFGVLIGTVAGWVIYDQLISYLIQPLGSQQRINFTTVGGAFDIKFRVSLWTGAIISSPWWISQVWIYISPGLSRRERYYTLGFGITAVILFLGGAAMGAWTAPYAVEILSSFNPPGATSFFTAELYISFYLRLVLVFGISALLPELLVALNFLGLVSAKQILSQWRWAVMVAFTFAAIANPLPHPWSMIVQALILVVVYFLAVAVAFINQSLRQKTR